jgi:DNA-binding CsgD family transcriptional regulator
LSEGDEGLVDGIYEAAVVADEWPRVLQHLANAVDAGMAAFITSSSNFPLDWRLSPGAGAAADAYLRSDAPQRSQAIPLLLAANWAGFLTEDEIWGELDAFRSDVLMTEWGAPNGFDRGTATAIQVPNGDFALVHIQRHQGEPGFSAEDVRRLNALRPHLGRAAVLASRWRQERLRSATHALELLGLPAAVLDPTGRVLAANGLIEAMTSHIVWGARDRLSLVDARAGRMLQDTIDKAAAQRTGEPASGSFPASDARSQDTVVFHAVPIEREARGLFGAGLTLLAVTRPGRAGAPDPALIQGLFDLTAAEARVAAGLIEGRSVTALATQHGVGVETVRSQVKSILGKTGARRQAEFVATFRSVELPSRS